MEMGEELPKVFFIRGGSASPRAGISLETFENRFSLLVS